MAVDFDGTDDYLDCGSAASLDNLTAANISIAAWLQPDSLGDYVRIVEKAGTGGVNALYFCEAATDNSKLNFSVGRATKLGTWTSATGVLVASTWVHVIVTYNGSSTANNPIFYKNGVVSATTEVSTPSGALTSDAAGTLYVGRYVGAGAYYFNGRMEDVRIFNKILTTEEAAILGSGYRGPLGGEVMWLPMDGARATPVFDGATLSVNTHYLNDFSHNGNHGNPTGDPLGYASNCPRTSTRLPQSHSGSGWAAPAVALRWKRRHGRSKEYTWT